MNAVYASTVKKTIKGSLIILAIILCLAGAVLFLQSMKFASSLWVLLEFGYTEWSKYLLRMLRSLVIWAILSGVIFSIQSFIHSPADNLKKILYGIVVGFVIGFAFTYFVVFVIGSIFYIPLGIFSLFVPGIIKFATLEFTWLVAAYIIFVFIAVDTPRMLWDVIKKGNWYFRLLGTLGAIMLIVQILEAITGGLLIIMNNSIWQTYTALIALGLSLLVTIIVNIIFLRHETILKIIFAILIVYIASIITGNVSYGVFHWGDIPSVIFESFMGPIAYSAAAKFIVNSGINGVASLFGILGGIIIGLFIAQYTHLRIIGQNWFGILCGTLITIGFGIAFGLLYGPALSNLLISKIKINPIIGFCVGAGVFFGIIIGMVLGGFTAR